MNCGGVITFQKKENYNTILVMTKAGNYGFPKGKREKGETIYSASTRELLEETGVEVSNIKFCATKENKHIKLTEKSITYYIAIMITDHTPVIKSDRSLKEVKWISIDDALKISDVKFKPIRKQLLRDAYEILLKCDNFINTIDIEEIKDEKKKSKRKDKYNKKIKSDKDYDIKLSKFLTLLLRHKAKEYGLKLNDGGYIKVNDLLKLDELKSVTSKKLESIVENSDKKRFSLIDIKGESYIRANQGHSLDIGNKIKNDLLLKEIETPFDVCFHGTYKSLVDIIKKNGLNRMKRKHIHLTNSMDALSGVRGNNSAFIYIDMAAAMKDNIKFYLSDNHVILTEGVNGILDPKYIIDVKYK